MLKPLDHPFELSQTDLSHIQPKDILFHGLSVWQIGLKKPPASTTKPHPSPDSLQDQLQTLRPQLLRHAITLAPLVPLYWRNAAVLLSLAGDLAAAQGAWERFRQMDAPTAAREEVQGIPRSLAEAVGRLLS